MVSARPTWSARLRCRVEPIDIERIRTGAWSDSRVPSGALVAARSLPHVKPQWYHDRQMRSHKNIFLSSNIRIE